MQSPLGSRFSRGAIRAGFAGILALAGVALLLSLRAPAQAQTFRPTVRFERTVTPQTLNVRDLIRRAGTRDLADGLPIRRREIPLGRIQPPSDKVGETEGGLLARPAAPRPRAPEVVFDTIPSFGGEPSDDGIAVGPNHVVSAANVSWGVYTRTGTELFRVPFLTWYQGLDNTGFIFDPRVDYDENTGRYYLVTVGLDNTNELSELQISISQTSDPLGNWHRYVFNARESNPDQWGDFPCFGYNAEALFCTTNNFEFNGPFTHTSLRIFPKAQMLSGAPVTPRLLTFNNAFTVQPITSHDVTTNGWMVDRASNSSIRVWKITNSLAVNPTIGTTTINVNPFNSPPLMAQSGSARTLDGGDGRMGNAILRNGQIWATHGVGDAGGGTRGEARVYHINPAGNGSLAGQFAITDPALNLHYPSIDMDQFGALLVGYATANSNIFPSMHYSIKRPADVAFSAPTLMSAGTIAYDTGGTGANRWGDYTDCSWDAGQPNIVWHSGQVAATQTLWVKRVGAVKTTPQSITVVQPNGGEVLERGVQTNITWTSVSFTAPHTVKIELLDTVALTTTLLAAAAPETAGAGTFAWTPAPGLTLGNRYKIRITSNEDATFFDESNSTFSVQAGSMEVLSPNGGEVVVVGDDLPIQWDAQDFAGPPSTQFVRIELSRDGGGSWEVLFPNAPNTGAAQWQATADGNGDGTTDALIRVTAVNSGLTFEDESDAPFEIRLPSEIECTQPAGGTFTPGQVLTIAWERQGFVGGVKVELSRNAGATWETLFPDVDGQNFAQWTVTGPPTKLGRVRVSSVLEPDVISQSLGVFEIALQSITVTAPVAGQKTLTGNPTTVTWNSSGLAPTDDVRIELSLDGGGTFGVELAASTPNDGSHDVTFGAASENALIRISLVGNPTVFGLSSSFSIAVPTLLLVSPNGGNLWKVGTQEIVQWSGTVLGHGQVLLEISRDNGATWGPLGSPTGLTNNDGAHSVGVSGPASKKVLVRVSWSGKLADQSDATLQIKDAGKKKRKR